jgi:hypothetical protein
MNAPAPNEAESRSIEAFQTRKKADFQPRWNRNIACFFLPGLLLIVLGGGLMESLNDGRHGNLTGWLLALGAAFFFAGMLRGIVIMTRYLRCPNCERMQKPGWKLPYRSCAQCGARLSLGWKDSR